MGKNIVYIEFQYYPQFQVSTKGFGIPGGKGELLHLLVCLLELYFAGLKFRVLYTVLVCLLWSKADITTDYKSKYAFAYSFFSALFRENQTSFHHFPLLPSQVDVPLLMNLWVTPPERNARWPNTLMAKPHPSCKVPRRYYFFHKE